MIGILGGTFNPIHHGHLRLAIEARERLGLREVRLVPAAMPPLRAVPAVPARTRLDWVRRAIAGEPGLVADGRELARPGPSYTVDTLRELRAESGREPLCLLLGQDAARRLPRWHRWRELLDLSHLVVFHRPGEPERFPRALVAALRGRRAASPARLRHRPAGLWLRCPLPPLAVSATDIRRRLRERRSVRGLVPDAVIHRFTPRDLRALGHE
ncbi:MAG TPA: nicotinate-nucleotide adenylyltransferase [Candidatus Binatia bacterium]|nr:nicotinate-nucleotide adenylyltransferase [Candidatus Binatia bacterium]